MKIHTTEQHRLATAELLSLMEATVYAGTPEAERLERLSAELDEFEQRHYPIPLPTALEALKFRMEQEGLQPADMVQYLGTLKRVRDVLSGKMPLTLTMMRVLRRELGIPGAVLINGVKGIVSR